MNYKDPTGSVLTLRNRRLSEPQKLPKRVSFKDEAWVIHIPARDENTVGLRESVLFTRNGVAGNSVSANRTLALKPNTGANFETFSHKSSFASSEQADTQTWMISTTTLEPRKSVAPYKSILKASASQNHFHEDHLKTHNLHTAYVGEASRHFLNNYFKHDTSHLLPSTNVVKRVERTVITRTPSSRRSLPNNRALGTEDASLFNQTGRPAGKEFTAGSHRTLLDHTFKTTANEGTSKAGTAAQPGINFGVVGVTYGGVNEMPYFYGIRGIANNGIAEYSSEKRASFHDRTRSEHSSVSTPHKNSLSPKTQERYLSAIPAIETFNRRSRGTGRYSSSDWSRKQDTSPKKQLQLPIAWQLSKQNNFSTK